MNNYTQNSAVYSKQLRITYLNSFQYNNTTTVCCHRTVHLYIKFTTSGASQCCIVRTAAQQSITSEWMTVLLAVLVGWTAMLHATTAGSMIMLRWQPADTVVVQHWSSHQQLACLLCRVQQCVIRPVQTVEAVALHGTSQRCCISCNVHCYMPYPDKWLLYTVVSLTMVHVGRWSHLQSWKQHHRVHW